MPRCPCTYILANRRNGTLYIGVTADLTRRMIAHRSKSVDGFSRKHGTTRLVHVERHSTIVDAIRREKQLKKWRRAWKIALIESGNPYWRDLISDLR
jgi:putative endonuclease